MHIKERRERRVVLSMVWVDKRDKKGLRMERKHIKIKRGSNGPTRRERQAKKLGNIKEEHGNEEEIGKGRKEGRWEGNTECT